MPNVLGKNIWKCKGENKLGCRLDTSPFYDAMPRPAKNHVPPDSSGARMKTLRIALGYDNQGAFAAFVGIESKRWNNFERGMPVSVEVAKILVRKIPGLSMDWIYLGSTAGLSLEMATRLERASISARSAP